MRKATRDEIEAARWETERRLRLYQEAFADQVQSRTPDAVREYQDEWDTWRLSLYGATRPHGGYVVETCSGTLYAAPTAYYLDILLDAKTSASERDALNALRHLRDELRRQAS